MGKSSQFKGTAAGRAGGLQTVRIPFISIANFRTGTDASKDARFVNCYFDPIRTPVDGNLKYYLTKRPGYTQNIRPPAANAVGRGCISWKGDIYSVWGNKIYKGATDLGVTLTTTTGKCGMSFVRPGAGTQYVCINDGTHLYLVVTGGTVTRVPGFTQLTITSSSVANPTVITTSGAHGLTNGDIVYISGHTGSTPAISDGSYTITSTGSATFTIPINVTVGGAGGAVSGFPSANTTDLLYKDGYFFVLKTGNTLWNCSVDDPTTWDPTRYITAQMLNSSGVGLAYQTNVIFVFGDTSFQAFYNNANATGSPLSNMESAMQQIGLAANGSLVGDETTITWVSKSTLGAYGVYMLDGITGIKEIGYPALNRLLRSEGTGISAVYAKMVRTAGRKFYILQLPTTAKRTFIYDYETTIWTEWTNAAGTDIYPLFDSFQHASTLILQHPSNGWIYTLDTTNGQDDATSFTFLSRLPRFDMDTTARKYVRRIDLIGDKQTATTNVSLQYSDDDYITLSTARTLDMNLVRPFASTLGNFRRRSWQLSYAGSSPLRIEALEMKVRMGDE